MRDPTRERLPREFFAVPPQVLAPALLGRRLVRVLKDGTRLSGLIVETEAYLGAKDRAAHTFGGRRTPRNEAMYGEAGTAYVYFTYGMHFCVNVVCGECNGVAVLLRALEPEEGIGKMTRLRSVNRATPPRDEQLCAGPARLCRALGIDRSLDRTDLVRGHDLFIEAGEPVAPRFHTRAKRVGVAYAAGWAEKRLRWLVRGNRHVSVSA